MNNSLLNALLKAADSESARNLLKELAGVDTKAMQQASVQPQGYRTVQAGQPAARTAITPNVQTVQPSQTNSASTVVDRIVVEPSVAPNMVQPTMTEAHNPIYADEIGSASPILTLEPDAVLNGIIWSEILGNPKSRRRH